MISKRRILVIAASSTLGVALLGGAALAGAATPTGMATAFAALPGPVQVVAAHLGAGGTLIDAALEYIGITREQFRTEVEAGKTLTEIAVENGKTRDGLVAAMVAAGNSALDAARAALPAKVEQLVDSTDLGRGKDHRGPRAHFFRTAFAAAVTYLDIQEEALRGKLGAGQSLGEIADQTPGKSRDELITVVAGAVKAEISEALEAGKITAEQAEKATAQADEAATKFVDATHRGDRPGFGRGR